MDEARRLPATPGVTPSALHYFRQGIAVASMMAGGTEVIDAVAEHIRLPDFDDPHRGVCETLVNTRRRGAPVDRRMIELAFYPEEQGEQAIRPLLRMYETLRDSPRREVGEQAVASLRAALAWLHREATALYLWFDVDDVLIYIGITGDLATRQNRHSKRSSWAEFADHAKIRRYPSRPEAEDAERKLIGELGPVFNHVHNDTPEARARLVAYLIEHGRNDLLAPAVSRG